MYIADVPTLYVGDKLHMVEREVADDCSGRLAAVIAFFVHRHLDSVLLAGHIRIRKIGYCCGCSFSHHGFVPLLKNG
tara:strand:- start:1624 stop:1854 length:231 start_codon:yes stop_codon:yes gene_type:complete